MVSRRGFMQHALMAGVGARAGFGRQAAGAVPAVRTVAEGQLRGEVVDGLQVFRGVPFAQPPVGPLRFRAPLGPLPYAGVRDATQFGAASVQPGGGKFAQSEDCLYLNVWAPAKGGPYPVFVWIHGGGFTGGRSFEPQYAGTHFAGAGVVCITVAYRLGALGFLDVSPLLGDLYKGSANNGLQDLMAALTWVQRNVAAFGGDPGRVTVGGESAGAKLTDLMLGIPAAAGLFHQAVSESGGAERISAMTAAQEVGRGFGAAWTKQTTLAPTALLTASARQIVDVQDEFIRTWPMHFPLRPELDASLIAQVPLATMRAGSARGKRVLVGTNRDESALFLGPHPTRAVDAGDLGNLPLGQFQPLAAQYRHLYPMLTDEQRTIRGVTAEEYWVPSLRVAEAVIAGGGEAFVYRLDFAGTGRFSGLAFHSYDIRFVWDSFGSETPGAAARTLANKMHGAWVAFLRGQAPAAEGLPVWPAYGLKERKTMMFDETCHVETDPSAAERRLWDGLLTR